MADIKVEYNGSTITYCEFSNEWKVDDDKYDTKKNSLAEVKKYMDDKDARELREKKKPFAKIPVFKIVREHIVRGFATSGKTNGRFWTVFNGSREKCLRYDDIFLDTPENIENANKHIRFHRESKSAYNLLIKY